MSGKRSGYAYIYPSEYLISQSFVSGEKNKHRYVIASQSQELRAKLRKIPAVPLVHITKSVMILEPPSEETLKAKAEVCLYLFLSGPSLI